MHRFATLVVVALAAALSAGCAAQSPRNRASSAAGPAVGLIAEGNAFQRSGMRNAVVAGIARATGRDVVVVDAPASADDGQTKDLAAKLAKEDAALARYNWRETRCAADWVMLTAARNGLAGVYRMTLDYAERRTPASKTDVLPASRHALRAVLGAIGLATPDVIVEESITGAVTVAPATGGASRLPLSATSREIEPTAFSAGLDVRGAVAAAVGKLARPKEPDWEAVARKLLASGCPFLALAVSDARGSEPPVRRQALAAMRRSVGPVARKPTAGVAPSAAEPPPAEPVPEAAEPPPDNNTYSCDALCSMHMIQICNRDKVLWSAHRSAWKSTPCGKRRDEDFLQDCYRQQWLNGAFHDSCVVPCEASTEGREQLINILRGAGCVRLRPS